MTFGEIDKAALLKQMRSDEEERDEILRKALEYLSDHYVAYVPLDVEEDINSSYEDDTLEEFKENVRRWIRELVK